MSLLTLGTAATTSLGGFFWSSNPTPANLALLAVAIKDDKINTHPIYPGAITQGGGGLYVPNRGVLKVLAGDMIGVDNRGWPILISADSIANGTSWTHS